MLNISPIFWLKKAARKNSRDEWSQTPKLLYIQDLCTSELDEIRLHLLNNSEEKLPFHGGNPGIEQLSAYILYDQDDLVGGFSDRKEAEKNMFVKLD